MALTATATSTVIDDIIKSLRIPRCQRFQVKPPLLPLVTNYTSVMGVLLWRQIMQLKRATLPTMKT